MAFFDKLSEMAKNAGDRTGDMIEVGKLNSRVGEAEKRIVEKKREIGEYCWAQYIANIQLDPEVARLCAAIKEDEALIAKTQAEIRSIKADKAAAPVVVEAGLLRCQECGTANPQGTNFCQECGARLETPVPAAPVEVATCPSCGFQNPAGTRFCQECGIDMEAPREAAPVCAGCGAMNATGDRFCKECGSVLAASEEEPPMETPDEPAASEEAVAEEAPTTELIVEMPAVEETVVEEPEPAPEASPNPEEEPAPTILCPACGTENTPGTRFCGECGKELVTTNGDL